MTLRSLERFVEESEKEEDFPKEISPEVEKLKSMLSTHYINHNNNTLLSRGRRPHKPFWYTWSSTRNEDYHDKRRLMPPTYKHGVCCFVDCIGRPQKDGHDMPMLPYQKLLYSQLHEHKQIWIKKSRGLGVTTFLLYWIAYCALTKWEAGDRVCVVVGPRIDLAEDFIARFKNLFRKNFLGIYSELSKQPSAIAILNNVKVEAFPSHHVDTMRGLDKVKFIISDESDYYPPFQQKEVRAVIEGYIGKPNSDPTIIVCSTPKAPGGLLQQIELEPNSLYYKLFFDYHYGLEGDYPIYSKKQLELARKSPDFPREFEGKYLGQIGNVISPVAINRCVSLGEEMAKTTPIDNWDISARYVMGVDAAWGGGSKFAVVIARYVNGKVQIIHSSEMQRPVFQDAINEIKRLVSKCHYGNGIQNITLDASNVEVYTTLCQIYGQPTSLQYLKERQQYAKQVNRPLEGVV